MNDDPRKPYHNTTSQRERYEVLKNDQRTTFHAFARSQASEVGGRFAAQEKATVVSGDGPPTYPQLPASSPWAHDPVPNDGDPTGYRIDEMEPVGERFEVERSLGDPALGVISPAPHHDDVGAAGSSPFGRERRQWPRFPCWWRFVSDFRTFPECCRGPGQTQTQAMEIVVTTREEANLIFDLAERYAISTLEVVRMVRLMAYGPLGYKMYEECGLYQPGADEKFYALRIAKRLAERPPISELLEIYHEAHEICVWQGRPTLL